MLLESPYRQLLIMALVGSILSALALISYRSRPAAGEWRHVRPGATHWFGLLSSEVVFGFLTMMGLRSGPPASAADSQWLSFVLLWAGSGIAVLVLAAQILLIARQRLSWRGSWIAFRGPGGSRLVRSLDEISRISGGGMRALRIEFANGERVLIDPYSRGGGELLEHLAAARRLESSWP